MKMQKPPPQAASTDNQGENITEAPVRWDPRDSVILCGCPRYVRRPYDLPALWVNELPALRAEGIIAVWHRPGCTL
jgi:hypothetical protein